MTNDDTKLFTLIANNPSLRQKWLRDAKELMPEHPAVREQVVLDEATAPLEQRLHKLEQELEKRDKNDVYESERAKMRQAPYNFNEKKIKELEDLMGKAADEDGVVFKSYSNAAEYIRRREMPLGPSTASFGMNFGISSTAGAAAGAEKWREQMKSRDPKINPALMNRRDRKEHIRKLAQEAGQEFKESLGM